MVLIIAHFGDFNRLISFLLLFFVRLYYNYLRFRFFSGFFTFFTELHFFESLLLTDLDFLLLELEWSSFLFFLKGFRGFNFVSCCGYLSIPYSFTTVGFIEITGEVFPYCWILKSFLRVLTVFFSFSSSIRILVLC